MAEEEEKKKRGGEVDGKTVFIRGLPFTFNDSQLEEAFSDVGPVRRAFTVKEKATGKHRGVAFVQFALAEDAQRAIELKNQTLLDGRKIKVEIAKRRAPLHERKKKKEARNEEHETPAEKKSDKTERAKTLADQKRDEEAAPRKKSNKRERAPGDETKQEENKAQKLSRDQSAGSPKQRPARTIVIGNMTLVDPVVKLAQKLGNVESIDKSLSENYLNSHGLSRDGCKPFAVAVVFTSVRAAREAVATFHNKKFGDGVLWARQLGGEGAKPKNLRLIVRNLPFQVTEEILRQEFSKAGFVWELTIPRKTDGVSKGFAFVGYTSKSEAEKAIKDLNGKKILKRTIAVDWAVAKNKYEDIKTAENEKNEYASDETASEAESDDENLSDEDEHEPEDSDEEEVVKKVLDKVVKAPEIAEEDDEEDEDEEDEDEEDEEEDEEDEEASDARPKNSKPEVDKAEVMERTVFMRNLPLESNVNDLRKRFSEFGEIKAFRLVYNPSTRKPKGTAFVEFATREGAEAVVKAAEGGEQGASKLLTGARPTIVHFAVDRNAAQKISTMKSIEDKDRDRRNLFLLKEGLIEAGSKAADGVSTSDLRKREMLQKEKASKLRSPNFHVSKTRLAIHNFPKTMNEKAVKQLFIKAVLSRASKQNPVVKQVKLLTDEKENFRGSGFVEFSEHQHALVALRVLNNNPETFGSEKRPIVEFAIDNMSKLRKRETRIATYKNKERSSDASTIKISETRATGAPEKRKKQKAGAGSEKQPGGEKKAGNQKRKRDSEDGELSKRRKQKPVEETREPEIKTKKQQKKSKLGQQKASAEDEPKRRHRSKTTGGDVEDKLDKLVKEYRAKYFGAGTQSKSSKNMSSIKRWFE